MDLQTCLQCHMYAKYVTFFYNFASKVDSKMALTTILLVHLHELHTPIELITFPVSVHFLCKKITKQDTKRFSKIKVTVINQKGEEQKKLEKSWI